MWIEELDLRGFRGLEGRYRFVAGLTLVIGPNEAGKSSLHEGVMRALYGFSKKERRRGRQPSPLEAAAPWGGGEAVFGLNAQLHARGLDYRVEWDFREHRCTLRDATTGRDVSADVRGKGEDVYLGEYLLGIGLEHFRSSCCLEQRDLGFVENAGELGAALQQAVEANSSTGGADDAIALLNEYLRESVGVHVGHLHPSRDGALARAYSSAKNLADRQEATTVARSELAELAGDVDAAKETRREAEQRLLALEQAALRRHSSELAARVAQAGLYATDASAELKTTIASLPDEAIDLAKATRQRFDDARRSVQQFEREVAGRQEALTEMEQRQRLQQSRLDALAACAATDTTGEGEARDLLARLARRQDAVPDRLEVHRDPRLVQYRLRREELRTLSGPASQDRSRLSPAFRAAALVIAVCSLMAGTLVHPAAFAGLLLAAVVAMLGRRRDIDGAVTELGRTLEELGANSIDDLEAQALAEDREIAGAEARATERDARRKRDEMEREVIVTELGELLSKVQAPHTGDLEGRATAYLKACDRSRELTNCQAARATIDAELIQARQPQRDLDLARRQLDDATAAMRQSFTRVGVREPDPDEAKKELSELLARRAKEQAEAVSTGQARTGLAGVLQGSTLRDLHREDDSARANLKRHEEGHGYFDADDDEAALESARSIEQQASRHATELETVLREREEEVEQPAVLAEQLEEARARAGSLEQARDAVVIARAVLKEQAEEMHRAFAPHLNEALESDLPRLTGGRYRRATVGTDLSVLVEAPETGQLISAEQLSRGTRSQIYLIERLAITKALDPTTDGAPLILDDPFARFDDERRQYALEVIGKVASDRQVLIFSDDRRLAEELEKSGVEFELIELSGPDG